MERISINIIVDSQPTPSIPHWDLRERKRWRAVHRVLWRCMLMKRSWPTIRTSFSGNPSPPPPSQYTHVSLHIYIYLHTSICLLIIILSAIPNRSLQTSWHLCYWRRYAKLHYNMMYRDEWMEGYCANYSYILDIQR